MRRQRRRDTGLEMELRKRLHALGYRFRVDHRLAPPVRVRGDIVFTRKRVVVFVDGCFWHGCPMHGTRPKNNAAWWAEKLDANIERDHRATVSLRELGWNVVRIWEHEDLRNASDRIENAIKESLRSADGR